MELCGRCGLCIRSRGRITARAELFRHFETAHANESNELKREARFYWARDVA